MKKLLGRVDRKWKTLCLPFAFEFLLLGQNGEWCGLPNLAEHSAYLRRLELVTSAWTDEQLWGAKSLLMCCPKLSVLIVGSDERAMRGNVVPHQLMDIIFAVLASEGSMLHTLTFRSPLEPLSVRFILENTGGLTYLHSLSLRFTTFISSTDIQAVNRLVVLEHLHSLELFSFKPSDALGILKDWKLPSLRRFSLRNSHTFERAKALSFFEEHGSRLTILEFDYLPILAKDVLTFCPNLTDLITDVRLAVINRLGGHPNLQRVGLRGFFMIKDNEFVRLIVSDCLDNFFPFLIDKELFPKLSVIRLLDYDQDRFGEQGWIMSEAQQWSQWVQRFKQASARFEDHDGQIIKVDVEKLTISFGGCINAR